MKLNFLSDEHEARFADLIGRGRGISATDGERVPSMYILAGMDSLYGKAGRIYDFDRGHFIVDFKDEDEEDVDFPKASLSSSEYRMSLLAFDFFSGQSHTIVVELFRVLDPNNVILALEAIKLKYL